MNDVFFSCVTVEVGARMGDILGVMVTLLLLSRIVNSLNVPPCPRVPFSGGCTLEFNYPISDMTNCPHNTVFIRNIVVCDAYDVAPLNRVASVVGDVGTELCVTLTGSALSLLLFLD